MSKTPVDLYERLSSIPMGPVRQREAIEQMQRTEASLELMFKAARGFRAAVARAARVLFEPRWNVGHKACDRAADADRTLDDCCSIGSVRLAKGGSACARDRNAAVPAPPRESRRWALGP